MPVDVNLEKDGMIYQRDQYAKGGVGVRYWDYRDRQIMKYIVGEQVLDVGCGEGITLEKLVKTFPEKKILGVDAELENIGICKKFDLPIQYGTVYDLPFADDSFDTVLFLEVLEHLDTPDQALRELYRVVKPDGRVVIVVPNDFVFKVSRILTGKFKAAAYDCGHLIQWTPAMLDSKAAQAGLCRVASRNLPFFMWFMSLHHVFVGTKLQKEDSL